MTSIVSSDTGAIRCWRVRCKPIGLGLAVLLLATMSCERTAHAQFDPRVVLAQMVLQLQTGRLNQAWYGFDLWQTIAVQTGNTGIYPQLVQLGVVQNVTAAGQVPLPTGMLYGLIAQHQNGVSTWILGISTLTGRIEYANFNIGTTPLPLPAPQPSPQAPGTMRPLPATPQPGNPQPNPPPSSGDTSDACKRFPNLC